MSCETELIQRPNEPNETAIAGARPKPLDTARDVSLLNIGMIWLVSREREGTQR